MNQPIEEQLRELEALKLPELQIRFAEIVGEETKAPNKKYLLRRIEEALESRAPALTADASTEESDGETQDGAITNDEDIEEMAVTDEEQTEVDSQDHECPSTEDDLTALQQRYLEVVGRPTGSANEAYLKWKIRQAEQGKVPVGPTRTRREAGVARDFKVLPVRMEADLVKELDEAWKRQGLKSRMELFRVSLRQYFTAVGEQSLAEQLLSAD